MPATPQDPWTLDEDDLAIASLSDALEHDAYWARAHARENYFRIGLDYEDYAPAYCVGYVGQLQYGGEFEDAERSLWANWLRLKGDSRLEPGEARMAMRAAWDRCAAVEGLERAHAQPLAGWMRRWLLSASDWLDRAEQLVGGIARQPMRPVTRSAQQGGLARH